MNKLNTIFLIAFFILTFGVSSAYSADTELVANFDIIFDGFCDGANFTVDTNTGLAVGVYASSCATCPFTEQMAGTVGSIFSQGKAVSLSWNPGIGVYTVIRQNGTWTHYNYDGTVFNSGTWSHCAFNLDQAAEDAGPSTSP